MSQKTWSRAPLFLTLGMLGACSQGGTATMTGQLEAGAFALDNPVIVATSEDGTSTATYIQSDLTFAMPVPVGATYSFSIANSTRSGAFDVLSHIDVATEDGAARYVVFADAGAMEVGVVSPIDWSSAAPSALQPESVPGSDPAASASSGNGKGNSAGKGKGSGTEPPVTAPTCSSTTVVESATSLGLKHAHGAGGSGASAPFVADGGVSGAGNGAGEIKVTICHIPPGNPANEHTIVVGAPAVPAHLAHGDYLGACLATPSTPNPPACDAPPSGSSSDGGDTTSGGPADMAGPVGGAVDMAGPVGSGVTPTAPLGSGALGAHCLLADDCASDSCFASTCTAVPIQ
jgi:hypothetical protein